MRKFAIVTGGSKGIGLAVAKLLAQKGYDLALVARDHKKLLKAKSMLQDCHNAIRVTTHSVDLENAADAYHQIKAICQTHESIDLLFNNAGIAVNGADELEIEAMQSLMNINFIGAFAVLKAVLEKMKIQKSGYIINLSSLSGRRALARSGGYCASKFALSGFSESLFKRYTEMGIKVTAICPSTIDSDMTRHFAIDNQDKITQQDMVKTVDYLLSLGKNAVVPFIEVHCKALVD